MAAAGAGAPARSPNSWSSYACEGLAGRREPRLARHGEVVSTARSTTPLKAIDSSVVGRRGFNGAARSLHGATNDGPPPLNSKLRPSAQRTAYTALRKPADRTHLPGRTPSAERSRWRSGEVPGRPRLRPRWRAPSRGGSIQPWRGCQPVARRGPAPRNASSRPLIRPADVPAAAAALNLTAAPPVRNARSRLCRPSACALHHVFRRAAGAGPVLL